VYDVVTGEAVALDLRIAQLPSRIVAAVLDLLTMLVALYLVLLVFGAAGMAGFDDQALAAAAWTVAVVVAFVCYPVLFETLSRGRTLGKMAMGLRVVRDDGGPITFRHALVRGLVGLGVERPGLFLFGLGPALGMVVSMFSATGKRIGDMAAGTMVLQERVSSRPGWAPLMPAPLAGWATTLDITGLDDSLALSVRQFLGRAGQFEPAARERLGDALSLEVRACTTPPPPAGTPGWAYLTAVLAERRRREEARVAAAAGLPPPPTLVWPPPMPPPGWRSPYPPGPPYPWYPSGPPGPPYPAYPPGPPGTPGPPGPPSPGPPGTPGPVPR